MTPGPTNATGMALPSPTPGDIRDIRGPLVIPIPWLMPALIAGGVVLALLLGWLARRWWKRRKLRVPPPRPADEVALERLEAARKLIDPERAREFCFAVTEAVRFYIEDRFAVHAARRTTDEFLNDLVRTPTAGLASHAAMLGDVLRQGDLVKFARATLARDEMEELHQSAVRFVRETRTGSAPPATAPASPATTTPAAPTTSSTTTKADA
jgi:hypothetical protein